MNGARFARTSAVLMAFWLLLVGTPSIEQVTIGLVVCAALARWVPRLTVAERAPRLTPHRALGLLGHAAALVWSTVTGGVQVAWDALRPHPSFAPRVVERDTGLSRTLSQALYVNTITLSPGTLALDSDDGTVLVHCLSERFADALEEGRIEYRIAQALEE